MDDIQMGCGRTGDFFSFEEAGISPDIVTLSKSLSGYGLPFSLLLIKPELDHWSPGQHNGTFRGHNLAFVTGKAALDLFWQNDAFAQKIQHKGQLVKQFLMEEIRPLAPDQFRIRGRGMVYGIDCGSGELAGQITQHAFEKGVISETSGADGEVVKFLAPLTIEEHQLEQGLHIWLDAVRANLPMPALAATPAD